MQYLHTLISTLTAVLPINYLKFFVMYAITGTIYTVAKYGLLNVPKSTKNTFW